MGIPAVTRVSTVGEKAVYGTVTVTGGASVAGMEKVVTMSSPRCRRWDFRSRLIALGMSMLVVADVKTRWLR